MGREKFKTLILFFLFTTSLVLMFLDTNLSKNTFDLKIINNTTLEESLNFVMKPQRIFVHFGGENNTEIIDNKEDYWNESKGILKESLSKKLKLEEISYKEYKLKKNIKSIELIMPIGIDGKILNKSINIKNSPISNIKGISEILIPLVDDKGVYFLTDENKVYKIKLDYIKNIELVNNLENQNYIKYYTINSMFPLIDNNTLLPLGIDIDYPYLKSKPYFSFNNEYIQHIAQSFFKEKYAFTNRIVDINGLNTFIYGYGEKVLRIDPDGYIEYLNENNSDKEISKEDALLKVLNFLRSQEINIKDIYLSNIVEHKSQKTYVFNFSYSLKNLKVEQEDVRYPIEVKVIGDSIGSYKNSMRTIDYNINNDYDTQIMIPQEVLDINFNLFKKDLGYSTGEDVLKNLKCAKLVYFLKSNQTFIPAWHLSIGEKKYIFDAYKGEYLYGLGKS